MISKMALIVIYTCMHLTAITGSASGGIVLLTAMVVTISL